MCDESQDSKYPTLSYMKVNGPADLNHMVFELNQEASSTLWFPKEVSKNHQGNGHLCFR